MLPKAWYNRLVPEQSSESTFFATNAQSYGYMGLQQVEKRGFWFEGKAIFSIWDSNCAAVMDAGACPEDQRAVILECGKLARCDRFGNEGTGVRSTIRFDEWDLGKGYSFVVEATPVGHDRVRYDGYLYAAELGGWVLLSKILVPRAGKAWQLQQMSSFVEQWTAESYDDHRWGSFGASFVEGASGAWQQITSATFKHTYGANEDSTHVSAAVTDDGLRWGMGAGGTVQKDTAHGTTLHVSPSGGYPTELSEYIRLRSSGLLESGCEGGTCGSTAFKRIMQDALTKTYLPIWIIGFLWLCCCCCPCLVLSRCCTHKPKREEVPCLKCVEAGGCACAPCDPLRYCDCVRGSCPPAPPAAEPAAAAAAQAPRAETMEGALSSLHETVMQAFGALGGAAGSAEAPPAQNQAAAKGPAVQHLPVQGAAFGPGTPPNVPGAPCVPQDAARGRSRSLSQGRPGSQRGRQQAQAPIAMMQPRSRSR